MRVRTTSGVRPDQRSTRAHISRKFADGTPLAAAARVEVDSSPSWAKPFFELSPSDLVLLEPAPDGWDVPTTPFAAPAKEEQRRDDETLTLPVPLQRPAHSPPPSAPAPRPAPAMRKVTRSPLLLTCLSFVALVAGALVLALGIHWLSGSDPDLAEVTVTATGTGAADAAVLVDGAIACNATPCRLRLQPGVHWIQLQAGAGPTTVQTVDVDKDRHTAVHFAIGQ